jgi:hypothetical protein
MGCSDGVFIWPDTGGSDRFLLLENGANIPKTPNFHTAFSSLCPVLVRSSLQFRLPTLPKSFHLNLYLFFNSPILCYPFEPTVPHPQNLLQFSWAPTDDI